MKRLLAWQGIITQDRIAYGISNKEAKEVAATLTAGTSDARAVTCRSSLQYHHHKWCGSNNLEEDKSRIADSLSLTAAVACRLIDMGEFTSQAHKLGLEMDLEVSTGCRDGCLSKLPALCQQSTLIPNSCHPFGALCAQRFCAGAGAPRQVCQRQMTCSSCYMCRLDYKAIAHANLGVQDTACVYMCLCTIAGPQERV
jgi:hypothetical protein